VARSADADARWDRRAAGEGNPAGLPDRHRQVAGGRLRVPGQLRCGDVTRLRQAGISGGFDLVIDIGCYHAIPARLRDSYAAEVAALTVPGADLYLAGIADPPATWRLLSADGVSADDLHRRFGTNFDPADQRTAGSVGRAGRFVLYHLIRKYPSSGPALAVRSARWRALAA